MATCDLQGRFLRSGGFFNQRCSFRAYSIDASNAAPQAAALIIGNEILNGNIVDTNTPWLAKFLYRSVVRSLL
jgi:hypothetical protein